MGEVILYRGISNFRVRCPPGPPSGPRYRGTSLIRNQPPLGPYRESMPRAIWGS